MIAFVIYCDYLPIQLFIGMSFLKSGGLKLESGTFREAKPS